jgi:hypothetical protein
LQIGFAAKRKTPMEIEKLKRAILKKGNYLGTIFCIKN